jgi:hypothetical protein
MYMVQQSLSKFATIKFQKNPLTSFQAVSSMQTNGWVAQTTLIDAPQTYEQTSLNPLNTELNPICHLLALLGAHPILHVSRIRVKMGNVTTFCNTTTCYLWPCMNETAGGQHKFPYQVHV